MLLSHRAFEAPSLASRMDEHVVLHSNYRVFLKSSRRMITDDAIFGRLRPLDVERSHLVVMLAGEVGVRSADGDRTLHAGDCFSQLRNRPWGMRARKPHTYLLFEWEPGLLGTRLVQPGGLGTLSPAALALVREAALPLAQSRSVDLVSGGLERILAILRAEGLPFDPVDADSLQEPVPPWAVALSSALDRTLSSLPGKPRLIDMEQALGWSDRQILRRLREYQIRFACHPTGGWRDLQRWWRLPIGVALMGVPGAKTETVAEALGYATPAAFCEAFANAGLPSPGKVRHVLQAL